MQLNVYVKSIVSSNSKILGHSGREDTETMREVEILKEKDYTAQKAES